MGSKWAHFTCLCTPNALGFFLGKHIFDPFLTHFSSQNSPFSRHFGIFRGPKTGHHMLKTPPPPPLGGWMAGAPRSANRQGEEQHREPHQQGQGRAQQTRRRGTARLERQPEQREQGTRMERMAEHAHGRQRQQRGWLGQPASQPAPPLPGARATPAQPASGGGCLPQPRWAVCATGAGAHRGQTSREGEKDIWWTAGTARGGTGHLGLTHTETQ